MKTGFTLFALVSIINPPREEAVYVLLAIAACLLLQIAYTHLPTMQSIFIFDDTAMVQVYCCRIDGVLHYRD